MMRILQSFIYYADVQSCSSILFLLLLLLPWLPIGMCSLTTSFLKILLKHQQERLILLFETGW